MAMSHVTSTQTVYARAPTPRTPLKSIPRPSPAPIPVSSESQSDGPGARTAPEPPDERALGEPDVASLFRRHARYVAGVATRLLGRDHEIDDVVQEVFLAATRGIAALREPAAAQAWLTRVAVRKSLRRLRWRRIRRTLGLDGGAGYEDLPDPRLSAEDRAQVARVYQVLDRLPAADRVAWTLRQLEDRPAEEIARLCGCSLATAKRRIARVDEQIRRELTDE